MAKPPHETSPHVMVSAKIPAYTRERIDHTVEMVQAFTLSEFLRSALENELDRFPRDFAQQGEDAKWTLSYVGKEILRAHNDNPQFFSLEEIVQLSQELGPHRVINWLKGMGHGLVNEVDGLEEFRLHFGAAVYHHASLDEIYEGQRLIGEFREAGDWGDIGAPLSAEEETVLEAIRQREIDKVVEKKDAFMKSITARTENPDDGDFVPAFPATDPDAVDKHLWEHARREIRQSDAD